MISTFSFRYTEIWSDDQGSKSIKLAEPKLDNYIHYLELILVDTQFCVNPWIKSPENKIFNLINWQNQQGQFFNQYLFGTK